MPLIHDANMLKQYIHVNPSCLERASFILAYAPYCANHIMPDDPDKNIYIEILNKMFQTHEYTIPFYYIGFLRANSQSSTAADCKGFLRSMCNDLDRIVKWYKSNGLCNPSDKYYINNVSNTLTEYVKSFISGVRKFQLTNGATESAIANYSPLIPYQYNITREPKLQEYNDNMNVLNEVSNILNKDSNIYENDVISKLAQIAMENANEIIDNIESVFHGWKCLMDIFTFIKYSSSSISYNTCLYLILTWCLNNTYPVDSSMFNTQLNDFETLVNHKIKPLKSDEFNGLIESMCGYCNGDINDMLTTEAWTALSEESQKYVNAFLKDLPKRDLTSDTYDLDALLSQFYTMRHVETNDHTNQFFLSDLQDIEINNYNFVNDNILVCEINSTYLAIPYINIVNDYKIEVITIDKNHDIKTTSLENIYTLRN